MEKYNGWSNYETWNCKLWLDNDEGTYNHIQSMAKKVVKQSSDNKTALYELSRQLKDFIEERTPALEASMYSDLLNSAKGNIDYYEIAQSIIEDLSTDKSYSEGRQTKRIDKRV